MSIELNWTCVDIKRMLKCVPVATLCAVAIALIFAGCAETSTEPNTMTVEKSYIMSFTSEQAPLPWYNTDIVFGREVKYPESWSLGLTGLLPDSSSGIRVRAIELKNGEDVVVAVAPGGVGGIQSTNTKGASYRFYSDWAAITTNQKGVVYDQGSEVSFLIMKKKYTNFPEVEDVGYEILNKKFSGSGITHTLNFPADDLLRFVIPRQIRHLSCSGSGSVTFRAVLGFSEVREDSRGVDGPFSNPIREFTVTCTEYNSAQEVQTALSQIANLEPR